MRAWVPGGPRRGLDGYVVPAGSVLGNLRGAGAPLTIGLGAQVRSIRHEGGVVLAATGRVGRIRAHYVVVGARCVVGRIDAEGPVTVQAGAEVQEIHAGGDVALMGPCHVERLDCRGDVLVVGEPHVGHMRHRGRLMTRW